MITCQNCGNVNAGESNFCRFCGTKFQMGPPEGQGGYNYAPRPYSWKTDEFQTQTEPRRVAETAANRHPHAPLAVSGYDPAVYAGYRCPRCGTSYLPVIERRVSTAGWIVFSVLLVFTLIFFWIGLLMKEDVSICPVCRNRIN